MRQNIQRNQKYDDGDEDGDNDRNENRNNNDDAASGSGPGSLIFNLITTPRSHLGITEEDWATESTKLQTRLRHNIYLHIGLQRTLYLPYKCHSKDVL